MTMNRKEYIKDIFQTHQEELLNIGVKMIGVFGSVARGDNSPSSDYDILVEFDENHHNFKSFNQLCDVLEKHIGNNYDLVTKQGLSPYVGEKILEEVEYVQIAS